MAARRCAQRREQIDWLQRIDELLPLILPYWTFKRKKDYSIKKRNFFKLIDLLRSLPLFLSYRRAFVGVFWMMDPY